MSGMLVAFLLAPLAAALPDTCGLAIVGAGPGGAYAAWRASQAGRKVCVFEMMQRPGGRVHSLRNQGPRQDLVVETGAYRFAPKEVQVKFGNFTWHIATPLTAALMKELKIPTAVYDPDPAFWDHGMHKVVDENGHNAGYLTFVERLLALSEESGAEVRYGAQVVALSAEPNMGSPLALRLASGEEVRAEAVVLNMPQNPVLQLLRSSPPPFSTIFPAPLYDPISYPIMKFYVHYEDAWWRNYLNHTAGFFQDDFSHADEEFGTEVPYQRPAPLKGQYHDGDVRCDLPGGLCRGYLQAFYGGETDGAVKFYAVFSDRVSQDGVVHLSPSNAHQRQLLSQVHEALVKLHGADLDAAGKRAEVEAMFPTSAVMSIWSEGVGGIHAGCHMPKAGNSPSPGDLPKKALQPYAPLPVFVANEAFGSVHCFAEGSLQMAEASMQRLNVSTPQWLLDAQAASLDIPLGGRPARTDPFLMPGHPHAQPSAPAPVAVDTALFSV